MALAENLRDWQHGPAEARQEWNNLRNQLETLLDQVHEQQAQRATGSDPSAVESNIGSGRAVHDDRRRDALRSVQRAVQRFNEHEEAPDMPAYSSERLQSAIEQIRASQNRSFERSRPAPRRGETPQSNGIAELRAAIGDISDRMTRFESLLEGRDRSGAMVEEVAQQMEQLTGVVEMLATSVGEQSHIKRIEGQIAQLAQTVAAGPDIDLDTFGQRIEMLLEAVDRLSAQQADMRMPEMPDYSHHLSALDSGVRMVSDQMREIDMGAVQTGLGKVSKKLDTMDFTAIEACLRSVYDRVDALEKNVGVPTPVIERLTRDLAEFTEVMKNGKGPAVTSTLVTRVDALNARLSEMEDGGQKLDGLKFDMEELRQAVSEAIEPRFSAIESQLGTLSDQFGTNGPLDSTSSFSGLEEQIRRLADRLDQTGNELTQLQTLYTETPQAPEMPDLSALADMVANRTQSALAEASKSKAPRGADAGVQSKDLKELEQRLSELFTTQRPEVVQQDLSSVESSLKSVNDRLRGLEQMLRERDAEAQQQLAPERSIDSGTATAPTPSDAVETFDVDEVDALEDEFEQPTSKRRLHPGLDDAAAKTEAKSTLESARDAMPFAPTDEVPLNAPAYPDPVADYEPQDEPARVPVPHALRADDDEYDVVDNQEDDVVEHGEFDVADAGPPPRPSSDFAPDARETEASEPKKSRTRRSDNQTVNSPARDSSEDSSRSTFIAAARRAAQQSNPDAVSDSGSQSLFGRALARFQSKRESAGAAKPEATTEEAPARVEPVAAEPLKAEKRSKRERSEPADIPVDELDDLTVHESVLSKYRRPILLGAAVIAVSLLTLNLVSHRLNAGTGGATTVSANTVGDAPALEPEPAAAQPDAAPINGADMAAPDTDFPVGSINETPPANPGVRVIDPTPAAEMPAPLELASFTPELAMDAPVMPAGLPETMGPEGLREAAENGDARAQFEVAAIFAEGRTITQDLAASARWFERSAAQGFAPAAYRLGNMYENGTGVEADLEKARFWYEKAAGYGNRMSMHNLASILAGGGVGEQDFASAAVWFEKAAGLGLTDSQFNLGMLYARGLGVAQDLANSYKWFSIAAEAGDQDAMQARDDIARSLDAETVSRLQSELAGWAPQPMHIPANFAPIGTWDEDFDPGPQIENREIILRVQAALNRLGYDVGTPDGVPGPKTEDAVMAFEQATGMNEIGEINPRLLAVLGSQPV